MIGVALCLSSSLCMPQQDPVAAVVAPASFETILWLHGGPERSATFYAAVRALGFTGINVTTGGDSALPQRRELRFYTDQLVPKGILELRDAEWQSLHAAYQQRRNPHKLVRPGCLSDPATTARIDKALSALREIALRRPIAVALGDEVSLTRHCNPLDLCYSATCQAGFRAFLAARYSVIDRLNVAWKSDYTSFAEINPWTTDRIRRREVGGGELPLDLRPWSDHLLYRDVLLARVVKRAVERCRAIAPDVPIGLTGLQPPSAFGGHDYARLLPELGFYEAYNIGGARALARSFARPEAVEIATLFRPEHDDLSGWVTAELDDMLAHGMNGVVVWSAEQVFGDDGQPSPFGRAFQQAMRSVSTAKQLFAGARVMPSPIWIVESQASVRAHWMLDSRKDGPSWVRRLSSYEAENSTSQAARKSWVRLFQDLGYQPRFVSSTRLPTELGGRRPRLIVLPAMVAMSDVEAGAIYDYVQRGGTVIADHGTGIYNEHLVRRKQAVCDELFGVQGRTLSSADQLVLGGAVAAAGRLRSGAAAAERRVTGKVAQPTGAFAVQIENRFGRGRAIYLNLAVCEYAAVRLDRDRTAVARDLRARVRRILESVDTMPPVLVRGEGLPTCIERVVLRTATGRQLLAIRLHALEDPKLQALLGRLGPKEVKVVFQRKVNLFDARSDRDLGTGTVFVMQLDPWRAQLLEIRVPR